MFISYEAQVCSRRFSDNFCQIKYYIVWILNNFPATQILCEINFGEYKSSKTPFFGAMNFVDLVNFRAYK